MAAGGDDNTLIKIAVFGFAMSIFATAGLTLLLSDTATSDYSFDEINEYRSDLSSFTGESMLSQTPWILTGVYTPWQQSDGISESHLDDDGWLYGESIEPLSDFYGVQGSPAVIKMNPAYKSSKLLSNGTEVYSEDVVSGVQWWYNNVLTRGLGQTLGLDPFTYKTISGTTWDFTGYRYTLDPTLPFNDSTASAVDGTLSLVWYKYNDQEGISGGLDIYGGNVLLASYSAMDIISSYNSGSGKAANYTFDFEGVKLNLNIRFDQAALESGRTLMDLWSSGDWEMAVTSTSAGMFLDVQNSNSYAVSVGSLITTFQQIYTFSMPNVDNELISIVLWLMVGLPMTLALALVLMRVVQAVKPL